MQLDGQKPRTIPFYLAQNIFLLVCASMLPCFYAPMSSYILVHASTFLYISWVPWLYDDGGAWRGALPTRRIFFWFANNCRPFQSRRTLSTCHAFLWDGHSYQYAHVIRLH
ncbi:hypothetical protein HD806DRAFT_46882 [Xylariaceae sp. AK1471]|nr:hypothetical protein HD806DRAFT_46882 [Xylariaceae sp. AK1471]